MVDRQTTLVAHADPHTDVWAPDRAVWTRGSAAIDIRPTPVPVACPVPRERLETTSRVPTSWPVAGFRSPLAETLSGQLEATLSLISGYSQTLLELELDEEERRHYTNAMALETENVALLAREILAITTDPARRRPSSSQGFLQSDSIAPGPSTRGNGTAGAIARRRLTAPARSLPAMVAASAALGGLVITEIAGLGITTYAGIGLLIAVGYLAAASRLRV